MEKNSTANYALRLPRSLKVEVERLAAEDGISVNQFIATAVAEKISAMQTVQFFAERKARADLTAFDRTQRFAEKAFRGLCIPISC